MSVTDEFTQLRKGLLELAVLQIVSKHKVYAADILRQLAITPFITGEGTLYPLLSRLKRQKLLSYDWVESESGPPRKYYALTKTGQERLDNLMSYWQSLHTTLTGLGKGAKK
jgi:PadR family transcriptional regulator PadR